MGEAKRRKAAGNYPPTPATIIVPDDLKTDIATSVRSIEFTVPGAVGGQCLQRTCVGYVLLRELGWRCEIALGGMVYRVGPDPSRQTFSGCRKARWKRCQNKGRPKLAGRGTAASAAPGIGRT
jgi:hypothetical protein